MVSGIKSCWENLRIKGVSIQVLTNGINTSNQCIFVPYLCLKPDWEIVPMNCFPLCISQLASNHSLDKVFQNSRIEMENWLLGITGSTESLLGENYHSFFQGCQYLPSQYLNFRSLKLLYRMTQFLL